MADKVTSGAEALKDNQVSEKHGIVESQRDPPHESRSEQAEGRDDASLGGKRDERMDSRDNEHHEDSKRIHNQPHLGRYAYHGNNGNMPWGGGPYNPTHSYGHPGNGYGHPPGPHYHPPHHLGQMPPMPNYGGNHYSQGLPPMHNPHSMSYYGNNYPNAGPMSYTNHGMPPSYPNMQMSDSASISSKGSKGGKKRTIDGVHDNGGMVPMGISAYSIRRTDSSSSATSTVTAGNNTSSETHLISHDSPHSKRDRSDDLRSLNMGGIGLDDHHRPSHQHRRENSADGSTTSSLSVGMSLASYEGTRSKLFCTREASPKVGLSLTTSFL